jgi:hypothetical protein
MNAYFKYGVGPAGHRVAVGLVAGAGAFDGLPDPRRLLEQLADARAAGEAVPNIKSSRRPSGGESGVSDHEQNVLDLIVREEQLDVRVAERPRIERSE